MKNRPTPPSMRHPLRRAQFFFLTKEDPHSQAELRKIALLHPGIFKNTKQAPTEMEKVCKIKRYMV